MFFKKDRHVQAEQINLDRVLLKLIPDSSYPDDWLTLRDVF